MTEKLRNFREHIRELSEEQLARLNERTGADPEEIRAGVAKLQSALGDVRRVGRTIRGFYDPTRHEFAIPLESAEQKVRLLNALADLSISAWEENATLIIDHQRDLDTLMTAGFFAAPEDQTPSAQPVLPVRPDPYYAYRYPSPAPKDDPAREEFSRARRQFERERAKEEYADAPEMDEELRRIVSDFDSGNVDVQDTPEFRARFGDLPTLTLFPQKYVWKGREAYERRSGRHITKEDRERLYASAKDDPRAMEEVVRMHVGLVVHILARVLDRWRGTAVDTDDLFQAGLIGLYRAAQRYEPDKGSFTASAGHHIEGRMRRFAAEYQKVVRLPVHTAELRGHYHKKRRPLEAKGSVDRDELAKEMEMPHWKLEKFERTYFLHTRFDPLDESFGEASGDVVDMNAQPLNTSDTQRGVDESERARVVHDAIANMTGREAMILCMRFGIIPSKPVDLKSLVAYSYGGQQMPIDVENASIEDVFDTARKFAKGKGERRFIYGRPARYLDLLETCASNEQLSDEDVTGMTPQERMFMAINGKLQWDQLEKFDVPREFSLEEVADFYGVTRERIRDIEGRALRYLKHPAYSKKLKTVLDTEI